MHYFIASYFTSINLRFVLGGYVGDRLASVIILDTISFLGETKHVVRGSMSR